MRGGKTMARQYVGKGSNGQIVNIMGGGSTSSSNKGNSSSSSSGSKTSSSSSSGNRTSNGYYTDREGNTYKLNSNGTYTDSSGKTRVPYSSASDVREGNSPYSTSNGNRISTSYNRNSGNGTYTITDKYGQVIKRQDFNARVTGDPDKKGLPGTLYGGPGAKPINTQLREYALRDYYGDDNENSNYTLEAPTQRTTNAAAQPQYGFGQHPYDKIGDYSLPSTSTPVAGNTGGYGIYNGVTSDKDLYSKIQQMKNFSQLWGSYEDPNVRKQMALNAQMIGDTIPGVRKGADGVWYTADGRRLYDTVYQPAEDSIPKGDFFTKDEIFDQYQDMADAQAAARQAQLDALLNELSLQRGDINSAYDDLARQAYVNTRVAESNLPQQLAAQGITGGAAESTLLGLATSYENNLYENERARQRQLADIADSENEARITADAEIAAYQAQANQAAFDAYLKQMAAQNAYEQWAFEVGQNINNNDWQKQQAEREWAYNRANNAYNMSRQDRQNTITDKNNAINWALATGDYSSLKELGIDTSYLEDVQSNQLLQLALEAERQRLANQAAQMQIANYSVGSSGSSGGSSRSSGSSSSSKSSGSSGSSGGDVVKRDSSGTTNTVSNPLKNLIYGRNGEIDPSTPNEVIEALMDMGKIRVVKTQDGQIKYYLIESR